MVQGDNGHDDHHQVPRFSSQSLSGILVIAYRKYILSRQKCTNMVRFVQTKVYQYGTICLDKLYHIVLICLDATNEQLEYQALLYRFQEISMSVCLSVTKSPSRRIRAIPLDVTSAPLQPKTRDGSRGTFRPVMRSSWQRVPLFRDLHHHHLPAPGFGQAKKDKTRDHSLAFLMSRWLNNGLLPADSMIKREGDEEYASLEDFQKMYGSQLFG